MYDQEGHPVSEPRTYFAETAAGAVVLVAVQLLSLPILVGGLALVGLVKLLAARNTASR